MTTKKNAENIDPVDDSGGQDRDPIGEVMADLRVQASSLLSAETENKEQNLVTVGKLFFREVKLGIPGRIQVFLEEGMPVNYQDPKTLQTALHVAASVQARHAIRLLIKTGECDFLVRDKKGRFPSEVAYTAGCDPALARLLGNKERKQADAQGIKLTRRPPPETKP